MKLPRRHFLQLTAGAAALPAASRIASAQTYPRPVRIIVGLRLTFRQNMKLDSPGPAAIGVQTVFVAGGGSRIQRFLGSWLFNSRGAAEARQHRECALLDLGSVRNKRRGGVLRRKLFPVLLDRIAAHDRDPGHGPRGVRQAFLLGKQIKLGDPVSANSSAGHRGRQIAELS